MKLTRAFAQELCGNVHGTPPTYRFGIESRAFALRPPDDECPDWFLFEIGTGSTSVRVATVHGLLGLLYRLGREKGGHETVGQFRKLLRIDP